MRLSLTESDNDAVVQSRSNREPLRRASWVSYEIKFLGSNSDVEYTQKALLPFFSFFFSFFDISVAT